ncbi:hypothetical protein FVE85_9464 [Porphyridium purpureum]|uniref:Uncharacterized protein n=1 Tax=Porphyridium purpureum TaxID=35688 RepID=A0A5J4YIF6_PORPP|nr:hypothetical protein FVE85_9464 [Porphyridium purpureum]|eukprot:POR2791..scf261_15
MCVALLTFAPTGYPVGAARALRLDRVVLRVRDTRKPCCLDIVRVQRSRARQTRWDWSAARHRQHLSRGFPLQLVSASESEQEHEVRELVEREIQRRLESRTARSPSLSEWILQTPPVARGVVAILLGALLFIVERIVFKGQASAVPVPTQYRRLMVFSMLSLWGLLCVILASVWPGARSRGTRSDNNASLAPREATSQADQESTSEREKLLQDRLTDAESARSTLLAEANELRGQIQKLRDEVSREPAGILMLRRDLEDALSELESERASSRLLRDQIARLRENEGQITADNAQLERQVLYLKEQIEALAADQEEKQVEIEKLICERDTLEAKLVRLENQITRSREEPKMDVSSEPTPVEQAVKVSANAGTGEANQTENVEAAESLLETSPKNTSITTRSVTETKVDDLVSNARELVNRTKRRGRGFRASQNSTLFREAVDLLESACELQPSSSLLACECGNTLVAWAKSDIQNAQAEHASQLLKRAEAKFQHALVLNPTSEAALFSWGLALCMDANLAAARKDLEAGCHLFDRACTLYRRLLAINAESKLTMFNCGLALYSKGKLLESASSDESTDGAPSDAMDCFAQAATLLRQCLELDANDEKAQEYLDVCEASLQNGNQLRLFCVMWYATCAQRAFLRLFCRAGFQLLRLYTFILLIKLSQADLLLDASSLRFKTKKCTPRVLIKRNELPGLLVNGHCAAIIQKLGHVTFEVQVSADIIHPNIRCASLFSRFRIPVLIVIFATRLWLILCWRFLARFFVDECLRGFSNIFCHLTNQRADLARHINEFLWSEDDPANHQNGHNLRWTDAQEASSRSQRHHRQRRSRRTGPSPSRSNCLTQHVRGAKSRHKTRAVRIPVAFETAPHSITRPVPYITSADISCAGA